MASTAVNTTQQERVDGSKLLSAAAIAAVVAAVLNVIVFFVLPAVTNSPLRVQTPMSTELEPLPVFAVIAASVIPAFIGAGVLALLNRFTAKPITIFRIVGIVFTVLSFGAPFQLGVTTTEALILNLMHVVAGFAIIFILTTRARAA